MGTKIFISWSGDMSGQVAIALKECLEQVFQGCEPFLSSQDIEKGARPQNRLLQELDSTKIGILCVTKENVERPWINFEAGYICKTAQENPVMPLLIDLSIGDIPSYSPLHLFQMVNCHQQDLEKMFLDLNGYMNSQLKSNVMSTAVENHLPSLMESIRNALASQSKSNKQTQAEMISEILELSRASARAARISIEPSLVHEYGYVPNSVPMELFNLFPREIREDRRLLREIVRMFDEYRGRRDNWFVTDNYECFEYSIEHSQELNNAMAKYREKTER